jgi:hypothetical protein
VPDDELSGPSDNATDSGTQSQLPGDGPDASETEVDPQIKELQDRLSQAGRRVQDAETRAQRAETTSTTVANRLAATEQRLDQVHQQMAQQETARRNAYLATLTPADREREEAKLEAETTKRRLAALEQTGAQRTPSQQDLESATAQQMQRIVGQAALDFGLDEGEGVAWDDPRLDVSSPETYTASVRRLSRKIALGQTEGATVPAKNDNQRTPSNGGGTPVSPRPTAARADERAPTEETYQRILRGYTPTKGVRATREELRKELSKAEAAYDRTQRGARR